MKELELKYGCNPNQKPSKIFMKNDAELPITVLNGKPGYINFLDAFNSWQLVKEIKDILGMIPGIGGKIKNLDIDEKQLQVNKAIIQSMTPKERKNPDQTPGDLKKEKNPDQNPDDLKEEMIEAGKEKARQYYIKMKKKK